jgi:multidrug efflux pump subunit AcrA (membrane-fusion protein)
VFVIDANNQAQQITVTVGVGQGDRIEVRGAVSPGDKVVIRGNERLQPGQSVSVMDG